MSALTCTECDRQLAARALIGWMTLLTCCRRIIAGCQTLLHVHSGAPQSQRHTVHQDTVRTAEHLPKPQHDVLGNRQTLMLMTYRAIVKLSC